MFSRAPLARSVPLRYRATVNRLQPLPAISPARAPSLDEVVRAAAVHDGLAVLDLGDRGTVVTWGRAPVDLSAGAWPEALRNALRDAPGPKAAPFRGGVVGWLGYEAGAAVERMPVHTGALAPSASFWRCEGGLWCAPGGGWHIDGDARFEAEAAAVLAASQETPPSPLHAGAVPPATEADATAYRASVRAALGHIAAGDVYQVCLAWEHAVPAPADPVGAWLALRAHNPAERGALLRHGDTWVLSNSPEVFLTVEPHGAALVARSVPIKGTTTAASGPAGAADLLSSPKERAELTMIVDLVRNDLGRVAVPGGVSAGPRRLRVCGDLVHAEQEVTARLAPGRDALAAAAAAFPPGSVTGAPKVRAMELIHALERGPRGVYTGAIGFFGDDGAAHLNVAIRTVTVRGDRATTHLGAGIVADSEPEREWRETRHKGAALARVLGAT